MESVREKGRELPVSGRFDVVVAGGGVAGVSAALAAAREGAKVAILEKEYGLGGLATLGNVVVFLPLCDGKGRQVIGGLGEELLKLSVHDGYNEIPACWLGDASAEERTKHRYRVTFNPSSFMLAMEKLVVETGISILYDTRFCDVIKRRGRIEAVIVENKDGRSAIACEAVVDASGDADICVRAGEATASLGGNVRAGWWFYEAGGKVKLCCMSDRYDPAGVTPPSGWPGYRGDLAADVSRHVIETHDMLRERLDKLKTEHPGEAVYPLWLSMIPGMRMTRRLEGSTTIEEADDGRVPADCVGLTGDWRRPGPVLPIPYSSLIARQTGNLITAGRCISSGSAWDVTRAIPTCVVSGQAAGTAAAMLCAGPHRSFGRLSVKQLQLRLERNGAILV